MAWNELKTTDLRLQFTWKSSNGKIQQMSIFKAFIIWAVRGGALAEIIILIISAEDRKQRYSLASLYIMFVPFS